MILDEDPRIINCQSRTPVVGENVFVFAKHKTNVAKKYLLLKYSLIQYFIFLYFIFYLYLISLLFLPPAIPTWIASLLIIPILFVIFGSKLARIQWVVVSIFRQENEEKRDEEEKTKIIEKMFKGCEAKHLSTYSCCLASNIDARKEGYVWEWQH